MAVQRSGTGLTLTQYRFPAHTELRSCVKVEVEAPIPNKPTVYVQHFNINPPTPGISVPAGASPETVLR